MRMTLNLKQKKTHFLLEKNGRECMVGCHGMGMEGIMMKSEAEIRSRTWQKWTFFRSAPQARKIYM